MQCLLLPLIYLCSYFFFSKNMLHFVLFAAIVVDIFFSLIVTKATQAQSRSVSPNNSPSLPTLPVMAARGESHMSGYLP